MWCFDFNFARDRGGFIYLLHFDRDVEYEVIVYGGYWGKLNARGTLSLKQFLVIVFAMNDICTVFLN